MTTVKHKYLQKYYGDVCTLINVLNLMVHLDDDHAEKQLRPMLHEKGWNKYLNKIKAKNRNEGYVLSYVIDFLRTKCKYEVNRHNRVNMRKLDFWKIIVSNKSRTLCCDISRYDF